MLIFFDCSIHWLPPQRSQPHKQNLKAVHNLLKNMLTFSGLTLFATLSLAQKSVTLYGTPDCKQNESCITVVKTASAIEGQCYAGTEECKTPFDLTGNSSNPKGASDFLFCKNTSRNYKCESDGSVTITWYTMTPGCTKSSNASITGDVIVRKYSRNVVTKDTVGSDGLRLFNFGINAKCENPSASSTRSIVSSSTRVPVTPTSAPKPSTSSDCTTRVKSTGKATPTSKPDSNYLINAGNNLFIGSLLAIGLSFFVLI